MAYEELIHSMEMDAALRVQEVRTAAQAFVDETLEAARGQADEICAGHLTETERRRSRSNGTSGSIGLGRR